MRATHWILALATPLVVIAACADSADTNATVPSNTSSSSSGGGADGGNGDARPDFCVKKTCETVEGKCGEHDDGCGGTFTCGECKTNTCEALTCERLGKTCGIHDDGCGTTVNCGACETTCAKDDAAPNAEPNDTKELAKDLGPANDYDNPTKRAPGMKMSDGDEDWFKIATTDGGFGGNPLITATVSDDKLEVTVFHVCKSQPDYSYCETAGGKQDDLVGKGCRAIGAVALNTDCKGIDESGTTYIRVRKAATDGTCHAYELTVKVE
ncbi:MAG: hypothetical protein KIT84_13795 [Labilithrix sp.]|nr:hypothetical protein [Labilithrix sp.]MCW5812092.1 hypothetical protein [Labilithrix sp.]